MPDKLGTFVDDPGNVSHQHRLWSRGGGRRVSSHLLRPRSTAGPLRRRMNTDTKLTDLLPNSGLNHNLPSLCSHRLIENPRKVVRASADSSAANGNLSKL